MKTDITRTTFRPDRHYSGVRFQQGRVFLEADFNEQVDIGAHRSRVTTRDVAGPTGAPDSGGGFQIGTAALLSAVSLAGQRGVAVGERGTVLATGDGGATWAAQAAGTTSELSDVSVVNGTNAWAVGAGATIMKGDPSAGSWQAQGVPAGVTADLRGVCFANASRGYAVGAGATLLTTTDSGATWTAQSAPEGVTQDINAAHFVSPANGWAVGDAGRILSLSGSTWSAQTPPLGFAANLRDVHFASAQVGWAVGDGATILRTADGGATWQSADPPLDVTANLRSVDAESETVVWVAGDDGTVLHSTDGGASWTQMSAPAGLTADLFGIAAAAGAAVAVGDLSTILTVPAAGAWTQQQAPAAAHDLSISAGRLYVDGILCENEEPLRYGAQPDYPGAPMGGADGRRLVYIDVWQRSLTALEDPSLREVALGGPDTSTRTKTVWQVKIADPADVPAGATCGTLGSDWEPASARSSGRLRAMAQPGQVQTDECMVPAAGGYRRLENQLYRAEIHEAGSGGAASFKWSRDNGSTVARLEDVDFSQSELTVSEPGRDKVIGFGEAAYVELSDEGRALRGEPGLLLEVDTVTGNTIKWKGYAGPAFSRDDFRAKPTVRRWEGAASVQPSTWLALEGGVLVEFDEGDYQTGDYWTIPARTRTATIDWPAAGGTPDFQGREGIGHRYAPLAFVDLAGDVWSNPTDCRNLFPPLTGLTRLFMVGGDGQEAAPGPNEPLTALPQDIEVGVMNGRLPVEGTTARFTILAPGDGRLGPAKQPTLDVETDSQGIAGAQWWLGKAAHSQEVEVRLLDAFGNEVATQTPLHFYASLSTADAVAYDPSACNKLAGKDTVQDAIDELCKQMDGGGTCTVTAFPGDDLQAAVDSLPAAGGELCLAAGEYLLDAPLRVSARTRVLIAGRGPATLLRARSSETAIAVTLCDAVTIRDLRVEGSGGPQPPGEGHLLGTITIDRSRSVDVLDCELSCAPAAGRARACLTYYGMALGAPEPNIRIVAAPPAGRIRLKGNRLNVGAFQTGILLVDVYEAIVADNHIRLGDPFAGPTIRKRDVHMLAFQADEIGRAVAAISRIAQAPRPELGGRVEDIVSLRNPGGIQAVRGSVSQVMDRLRATGAAEDLRKGTVELIKDVQQTGVARAPKETAQAVAVLAGELSAAGQGIVVAGDTAGTVQICDNVIDDAIQGIHVGISNRRTPVRERGSEVLISGNAVHLLVPSGWREDRHAVFVSNFDTASVVNTTATLRRPLPELLKLLGQASDVDLTRIDQTPVDGIRVIGELGYCMVVRGSSLREFATGVRVVPHPADPGGGIKGPGRRLWLVTETAAVGAVQAVDAPSPAVLQAMNFNPPG